MLIRSVRGEGLIRPGDLIMLNLLVDRPKRETIKPGQEGWNEEDQSVGKKEPGRRRRDRARDLVDRPKRETIKPGQESRNEEERSAGKQEAGRRRRDRQTDRAEGQNGEPVEQGNARWNGEAP